MQTIQLHASTKHDYRFPETVELQVAAPLQNPETDLDDALAVLLHAVRQSKNPNAMHALGTLLGYMETLEKKHTASAGTDNFLTLASPITMSF